MTIDNLKLSSKSLLPLALMALTVIAMVTFGGEQLVSISDVAGQVIQERDVGVTEVVRFTRQVVALPADLLASIAYDSAEPEGVAANKDYKALITLASQLAEHATAVLPEHASEIAAFKTRFSGRWRERDGLGLNSTAA